MSFPPRTAYDLRSALNIPWSGEFPHPTLVMGIVNVTPDSFQSEGRHATTDAAIAHARRLVEEGADILDIGGESTRPGAATVPVEEEVARALPVIQALAAAGVPLSVDTRKAEVARAALEAGARIVNDVSAGRFDPAMLATAAHYDAFLCLMHAPLDVETMGWSTGQNPVYKNVSAEVAAFLAERARAAEAAGVRRERIWVDPGFGFGKSVDENLELVRRLDEIAALGYPVLLGTSRKSTLGGVLGGVPPEERLEASLTSAAIGIANGAAILRMHDVAATVRAARMADAICCGRGKD